MKVVVYDRNPGTGFSQWFLKTTWLVGCFLQKLLGGTDLYYGASSWDDALRWLSEIGPAQTLESLDSIQYWGHGSPGTVWVAGNMIPVQKFIDAVKPLVHPGTILWFRTCSTFQGVRGHSFAETMADGLNCTVAAHTRIIGPVQGGLHTHRPNTEPSWPVTEGEPPEGRIPNHLKWGPNSVLFLATKVPKGW